MARNILVTGANGQLGSELQHLSAHGPADWAWHFATSASLNITSTASVEQFCIEQRIDCIINCAAYTAVDKAESGMAAADAVNHLAVQQLATLARKHAISLIHISTDYVFDGTHHRPYVETDATCPISVYGKTKLAGEQAIIAINPANSIIIRTSWLYSTFGNNFVKTMLRLGKERTELGVVSDQVGSPTHARDLAAAIIAIIPQLHNDTVEVFHYANEGVCSWYDLAKSIFDMTGIPCRANPIDTSSYPTPARRPHYSVLDKKKIKSTYGIHIPWWKDSLKQCLASMQVNNQ